MLLFLLTGCTSGDRDNPDIDPEAERQLAALDAADRHTIKTVLVCAVIADDSPTFPYRLVFLHRSRDNGVESQAELFGFDTSALRCGEIQLHLKERTDGTPVLMDFMPPVDAVSLRELRVYRNAPDWSPEDPYAVARTVDEPFSDYLFFVSLVSPSPGDVSTLFIR